MNDQTQSQPNQSGNFLTSLWRREFRPRLVSILRRPWTVAFLAAFASIAFGLADLGLGISVLRLDHPLIDEFDGSWWVVFLNSAAFWTGLMLAASSTVVTSWIVYEWNIAPRLTDIDGKVGFVFGEVNLAKAFRDFIYIYLWIIVVFTVLWLLINWEPLKTQSIVRYFIALVAGSIVLSAFSRCGVYAMAYIRNALNKRDMEKHSQELDDANTDNNSTGPQHSFKNTLSAPFRQNYAALIMLALVLPISFAMVTIYPVIPIATIYASLLIVYTLFKSLVYFTIIWRVAFMIGALAWISNAGLVSSAMGYWGNGRDYSAISHLNLQFPGFVADGRDFYADQPDDLTDLNGSGENSGGIKPAERLEAWADDYIAKNEKKPVLVVISTSGGAYRAGFWTGIVLDHFMDQATNTPGSAFADLPESIRLMTGASGGMVGASYFATRPAGAADWRSIDQLEQDILCSQMTDANIRAHKPEACAAALDEPYRLYTSEIPLPRQTLSAVAQHTLENDLPSILWGGWTAIDRGKVLEGQWLQLRKPVSFLGDELFRPSMIFSPMIVESGKQLLISDLDLSGLAAVEHREAVELFAHFPGVRETFNIRTAVRMQATFPYISPAVSLPTKRSNNVVDAGYYDNYGVVTAVQLLRDDAVAEVVRRKFAAIVLVEVRAFPDELETGPPKGSSAFSWASTPLSAVLSARGNSMNYRNRQSFRALQHLYKTADVEPGLETIPVHRLVFTNCTKDESLNWFVPTKELAEMRTSVREEWARNLANLTKIWDRTANIDPISGNGSNCEDLEK